MDELILPFDAVGQDDIGRVGGKGQNLGLMTQAGLPVPPGFCVTTAAFEHFVTGVDGFAAHLEAVDALDPEDVEGVREHAAALRAQCERAPIPDDVAEACLTAWRALGEDRFFAVRSSATLEDLPDASFAGQQDTYLNVRGEAALFDAVRRCWASLFTDRAVLYRRQQGFVSAGARLSVVVQQMARPRVSGILFTADPVTGHRGVCSIDASWGLGEALVSGLVNADLYKVDKASGQVRTARVAHKAIGIFPLPDGGTEQRNLNDDETDARVLSDADCARLAELGRTVEGYYGKPQDMEWCLEEDRALRLVQTRPITSLFAPPVRDEEGLFVYGSFGHVQVMTEPIQPFGVSVMRYVLPLGKDRPEERSDLIWEAEHRVFVDLTASLHELPFSKVLPKLMESIDPVMAKIVKAVMKRPEFKARRPKTRIRRGRVFRTFLRPAIGGSIKNMLRSDVDQVATEFNTIMQKAVAQWRKEMAAASLAERIALFPELLGAVFDKLMPVFPPSILPGVVSWKLLNTIMGNRVPLERIEQLTRGFEGNITTQMDLELGDLADMLRQRPPLKDLVREGEPKTAMDAVCAADDEGTVAEAWRTFIERYGHRGPGEIDASRPRWRDDPSSLVVSLRGMLSTDEIGGHRAQERRMREGAEAAGEELIAAARHGVFGGLRARVVRRLVKNVRTLLALREHGKYYALQFFDLAHRTALEVGAQLKQAGRIDAPEDVFMFPLEELGALVDDKETASLRDRVEASKAALARAAKLSVPRIITSDGEAPQPPPPENLPEGALGGLGASSGVVEGIARVVRDPAREVLHHGEILVAPFTDPGWTPLFVHASGLVMEVGGLVTHGSVVAREYGIPAVVGVDQATTRIKTGDRIRVDGGQGIVMPLPPLLDSAIADDPGLVPTDEAANDDENAAAREVAP